MNSLRLLNPRPCHVLSISSRNDGVTLKITVIISSSPFDSVVASDLHWHYARLTKSISSSCYLLNSPSVSRTTHLAAIGQVESTRAECTARMSQYPYHYNTWTHITRRALQTRTDGRCGCRLDCDCWLSR
jgi:hypothetical protein